MGNTRATPAKGRRAQPAFRPRDDRHRPIDRKLGIARPARPARPVWRFFEITRVRRRVRERVRRRLGVGERPERLKERTGGANDSPSPGGRTSLRSPSGRRRRGEAARFPGVETPGKKRASYGRSLFRRLFRQSSAAAAAFPNRNHSSPPYRSPLCRDSFGQIAKRPQVAVGHAIGPLPGH
jgi:hypothetical protein